MVCECYTIGYPYIDPATKTVKYRSTVQTGGLEPETIVLRVTSDIPYNPGNCFEDWCKFYAENTAFPLQKIAGQLAWDWEEIYEDEYETVAPCAGGAPGFECSGLHQCFWEYSPDDHRQYRHLYRQARVEYDPDADTVWISLEVAGTEERFEQQVCLFHWGINVSSGNTTCVPISAMGDLFGDYADMVGRVGFTTFGPVSVSISSA